MLSSNQLTCSNSINTNKNDTLSASQSSPRNANFAKEKLLSLSSNKEIYKKEANDNVNITDEIKYNINQKSININANNIEIEFNQNHKKIYSDKKIGDDKLKEKEAFEIEDIISDKQINFLNRNFNKKSEN